MTAGFLVRPFGEGENEIDLNFFGGLGKFENAGN